MGYFGTKLRVAMEENDLTLQRLSERTGISISGLHNVLSGVVPSPSRETCDTILRAFPRKEDIYDLTIAHLEDEFPAAGRSMVKLSKRDGLEIHEGSPPYIAKHLDRALSQALDYLLTQIPNNEDLRLMLIDLANALKP
jgi:transcriptional regulator with XRE-family HTH domain